MRSGSRDPVSRWVRAVLTSMVVVSMLAACAAPAATTAPATEGPSTAPGESVVAVNCRDYDASVLEARPLPESLNPALNRPDISQMTTVSTDLGADPETKPVWWDDVKITQEQLNQICSKRLKGVFLDWADATYNQAIRSGVRMMWQALGVDLIRITTYSFDPNGLAGNLAAVMPLEPDIIITGGTVDQNQMAAIMQPAVDAGITVVSWGVGAKGWTLGPDGEMANMTAYDFYQLGVNMGKGVCELYPDGAKLGYIHWINNIKAILNREQGFLDALENCPQIEVIAEGGPPDPAGPNSGFSDPHEATSFAAAFLARHPEVNVLFAPWEDPPGVGIEAAIKQSGLEGKVDIVTMDLAETGARHLSQGGTIKLDVGQSVYDGGRILALTGAMAAAGMEVPPFTIVPTYVVTESNLAEAWEYMHGPEIALPIVP